MPVNKRPRPFGPVLEALLLQLHGPGSGLVSPRLLSDDDSDYSDQENDAAARNAKHVYLPPARRKV